MPVLGLSKLEAVNALLESIGHSHVAALDTGGFSDAAQAERVLDRTLIEQMGLGWHDNVVFSKPFTPEGEIVVSGGTWTESTNTLNKTAAFASYTFAGGDMIYITGGTGAATGWYEIESKTDDDNIVLCRSIGSAADGQTDIGGEIGPFTVTVPATTLAIVQAAPTQHRRFGLIQDVVKDLDRDTTDFGDKKPIYLDVTYEMTWDELPPPLKAMVMAEASRRYQRREIGDPQKDAYLTEEAYNYQRSADPAIRMGRNSVQPQVWPVSDKSMQSSMGGQQVPQQPQQGLRR
jgi:hypothetical protein